MQVPQVLLDRQLMYTKELASAKDALMVAQRDVAMTQAILDELSIAIDVLQDAPESGGNAEGSSPREAVHRCPTGDTGPSGHEAAEKQSTEKLRTRRPIREMVLSELKHSPVPMTVKEIMHAVQAPKQVVLKALDHHLETGKVTQVEGARWIAVKPKVFPIEFKPNPAAAYYAETGMEPVETVTENSHVGSDFVDYLKDEGIKEEQGDAEMKDRIVALMKDADGRGLEDEDFDDAGIPPEAVEAFHQSGLLFVKEGRFFLNEAAKGESA